MIFKQENTTKEILIKKIKTIGQISVILAKLEEISRNNQVCESIRVNFQLHTKFCNSCEAKAKMYGPSYIIGKADLTNIILLNGVKDVRILIANKLRTFFNCNRTTCYIYPIRVQILSVEYLAFEILNHVKNAFHDVSTNIRDFLSASLDNVGIYILKSSMIIMFINGIYDN